MLKLIKKNDNIIVLIILGILISICTFTTKLNIDDELWNFSNIYKMVNGYTIYKDCNVIITPLFFYIGTVLFKILGANYFVFKIYSILINTGIYWCIYKLFKLLDINKRKSFLYTIIILIFTYEALFWGANYNNLAVLISILGIILLLKGKSQIFQGLIIFLIFMCKQNLGVYYAIGISIYKLWTNKDKKQNIKYILLNLLIASFLIIIYMIYLYFNGNLYNFINMAFLGIPEFAIKNISLYANNVMILIFQILMLLFSFFIIIYKKTPLEKKIKNNIKLIFCVGLLFSLISYPIFNTAHLLLGNIFIIICFIYIIENILLKEILVKSKIINGINVLLIIIFATISICYSYKNLFILKSDYNYNHPYYGVKIDLETKKSIEEICNYIKQNKANGINTVIISCKSNLYMNVLKFNNNKLDLPFVGNLGRDGEDGLIQEIENIKNTYILISKDGKIMQESEKTLKYITDNLEKIGVINNYYIYKSMDL